jgi:oxygen-independent coproporphyrinogen III oxidase
MLPAAGAAYIRRTNTASLFEYQNLLSQNKPPVAEAIPVDREDAMFETVMLGLRTADGVRYSDFEAMHGVRLADRYAEAISQLQSKGWLRPVNPADPRLALNERGLALQNAALMPFMRETPGKP